ncbi:hypothetical protein KSP35_02125 [Aquihabitans sp. G128]|uniref:hypothetical protein n=1 Tax=Aquihabitans sp. G128 TaxID=2849779 RepID=UPI001C22E90F|nr:hypothetical protein [Aquihabitans sp. G128]QXC61668.1 hypothetical protein KSP35_02125 [Aquihabitans sp. G128]
MPGNDPPPRPPPPGAPVRHPLRATAVALALAVALAGCGGSSDSKDPESAGLRKRSIEVLRDFGLTAEQAACITDDLGAETVVEAADVQALTEGQAYRDAAKDCIS